MKKDELRYLQRLAEIYPTIGKASTEIINLQSILNLPKGTEHFMSDLHGEYQAFSHVLRNGSGAVRKKIDDVFGHTLSNNDKRSLATLIYYPKEKMDLVKDTEEDMENWYKITLYRLIEICKTTASKYTRSKVRKALPADYAYVIEELITENTVAIVPVHVYGNICNVEEIQRIADKYSLKVIYDAAHAFGVTYKGKGIGNYGDASVFSFHATKVFNTIEGGAVTFSDPKLYDKLYNLKNFGIRGEELVVSVGANAKMNEFAAIMGLCNLKHIDTAIQERKIRYERYYELLSDVPGIRFFDERKECQKNYAYFPIVVEEDYRATRDGLYDRLKEKKIYARKYFYPLTSDQACFKNKYRQEKLEYARSLSDKVLVLP